MESKIIKRDKHSCEALLKGNYDDEWGHCNFGIKELNKILAVTGFGHLRNVRRGSKITEDVVEKEEVTTGTYKAIMKYKFPNERIYISLIDIIISRNFYEAWLDKYGKKIKTHKIDIPVDGDMKRVFIDVNEPAMKAWMKKFTTGKTQSKRKGYFKKREGSASFSKIISEDDKGKTIC